GHQAIAAPVGRARHLAPGVGGLEVAHARLERRAPADDLALTRGPRAQLAAGRAAREIGIGFEGGYPGDGALDAHLAMEFDPEEHQRSPRVSRQLVRFAALVAGEE